MASSFSEVLESSSGAAGGLTTSRGCGSNVTRRLGRLRSAARRATRLSRSRCPRWTPSNVPTVTTAPNESRGNARVLDTRSVIVHNDARVEQCLFASGHGDEIAVAVDQSGERPVDLRVD